MRDFRFIREVWEGKRSLGPVVEFAAALPATGTLFTVAGGRIVVTSIVGEITVVMDANATALKLVATPTSGTATDMCTATDVASYAAGDLLSITGDPVDPLLPVASAGIVMAQQVGVVVKAGTIDMDLGAGGQVTGRI
ncbi:MAG: hypothetical protein NUV34_06170, partial [Sulfuricaulis sp.]|nr:hypothetical protein [Sulfuricaulis sp.]